MKHHLKVIGKILWTVVAVVTSPIWVLPYMFIDEFVYWYKKELAKSRNSVL